MMKKALALFTLKASFWIIMASLLLLLCSCQSDSAKNNAPLSELDANVSPIIEGNWYRAPVAVRWQWQLLGDVNTSYNVEIYDIDLFDSSGTLISQLQA